MAACKYLLFCYFRSYQHTLHTKLRHLLWRTVAFTLSTLAHHLLPAAMNDDSHDNHDNHDDHNHGDDAGDNSSQKEDAGSDHNMDGMSHEGMSPYLFTKSTGFFVLFEEAFINSAGAFAAALIISFFFAILVTVVSQLIRVYESKALSPSSKLSLRLLASFVHGFRQLLHYVAMLIVMTMNVWLIIAVVLGHAVGWLFYAVALSARFPENAKTQDTSHC